MYTYARWQFIDRHAKQKFDSIAAGHKAALAAMGLLDSAKDATQDEGPYCPDDLATTFEKYRELKFTKREDDDGVKLYARDTLRWPDLVAYSSVTGQNIGMYEAELIMGLDAIFEGRNDDRHS